jgi:hypothetical protein
MEIEINGVKYRSIESGRPGKKGSRKLNMLLAMAAIFSGDGLPGVSKMFKSSLPRDIDIIKEFELIGQKKSALSASQRREVIGIFLSQFKPIN